MKITPSIDEVQTMAKVVLPFIEKKSGRPVLNHAQVEANGVEMRVTATDSFGLVSYTIPSELTLPEPLLVPRAFFETVAKAKDVGRLAPLDFDELVDGAVTLTDMGATWSKRFDYLVADFPQWRQLVPKLERVGAMDDEGTELPRAALRSDMLGYLTAVKRMSWEMRIIDNRKAVVCVAHELPASHTALAMLMPVRTVNDTFADVVNAAQTVKLESVKTA